MRLGPALLAIVLCAAASLALTLSIAASAEEGEAPAQAASVVWDDRPDDVAELAAEATVLVQAQVTGIESGPDLLSPGPDSVDGAIPTQRIVFETVEVLDGQIAETFTLFKTGSSELYLQGDPLYELGQSYVLFLVPQGEPGTYLPAAPDGRLALDSQGQADAVIGGPVAQELDGLTPEQIEQEAGQ